MVCVTLTTSVYICCYDSTCSWHAWAYVAWCVLIRSCYASTCLGSYASIWFALSSSNTQVSHKRQQFVKKTSVKFNNRFVVAGTQQLDSTWKDLKKWKPIAFAQKDKVYGGTNENRWQWARSFQWRHNAAISSSILEELPTCLWQSWKIGCWSAWLLLNIEILTSKVKFQTFFCQREKW